MTLVANDQPMVSEQPPDRVLDLPSPLISLRRASIRGCRSFAPSRVRTDQFDARLGEPSSQGVTVGGPVIDQPLGSLAGNPLRQRPLNQLNFRRAGTGDVDTRWGAAVVDQASDLCPIAPPGRAASKASLGRTTSSVDHRYFLANRFQPVEPAQQPRLGSLQNFWFARLFEATTADGRRREVCC